MNKIKEYHDNIIINIQADINLYTENLVDSTEKMEKLEDEITHFNLLQHKNVDEPVIYTFISDELDKVRNKIDSLSNTMENYEDSLEALTIINNSIKGILQKACTHEDTKYVYTDAHISEDIYTCNICGKYVK